MLRRWPAVLLCIPGLLIASRRSTEATPRMAQTFGDGFVPFAMPTTADAPGTIFRLDSANRRFIVADLSAKIRRHEADVVVPHYRSTSQVSAGFLVKMLQKLGMVDKANTDNRLDLTKAVELDVESAKREYTIDAEVEQVIREGLGRMPRTRGNRYFVIRETVSGKHVRFSFGQGIAMGGSVGADARTLGAAQASFSANASGGSVLDATFTTPHRVLYKAEQITVPMMRGSGTRVILVPVDMPLEWDDSTASSRRP